MKTRTSHSIELTEPETREAIAAFLRNRDIPMPESAAGIVIKWTKSGEATVSFALETDGKA